MTSMLFMCAHDLPDVAHTYCTQLMPLQIELKMYKAVSCISTSCYVSKEKITKVYNPRQT